ncbi:hypothetical protein BGV54_21690 [Burkholderia ubonensis]|uniref:transposase n=1 Tax=Burkholderia ubonensis TaxID=101571 RepID=UPI0008FDE1E2|nr:transposase [Burkholderia ubonensis]OJB17113.1 hypothetical protein BGV54_21690 [Burkholderia ubonensis]
MFNERGQVHMNEQEDGLQSRLVVNRKRDGRRKYDEVAKRELIEACLKPGVSIARTAMEHGINRNLVRTWISKYQREQGRTEMVKPHESRLTRLTLSYRWSRCVALELCKITLEELTTIVQMLGTLPCSSSTKD